MSPGQQPAFPQRLMAGGCSGAFGIFCFNWAEVIKTQVQTDRTRAGVTMLTVARRVYASDGIVGFWAGVRPNIARTFLVCAAELGTYDEAKTRLRPYLGANVACHVSASAIAGVSSALVSTPADVIKTRLMNSAGGQQQYTGIAHAMRSIIRDEDVLALYKGFMPIVVRKVIWASLFFVSYEQLRAQLQ